jgi:hypothetical protein
MRQTFFGLVAAIAVVAASSVPAMACGFGGCSPCGEVFSACAQPEVYVPPAPVYSSCGPCGGWAHERLPDPVHQYYYADQGPSYTGPGDWAPRPGYEETAIPTWAPYRHHPHYYGHYHTYHYGYFHHGYMHHHGYAYHDGYREHALRRYY